MRILLLWLTAVLLLAPRVATGLSLVVESNTGPLIAPGDEVDLSLFLELNEGEELGGLQLGFDISGLGSERTYRPARSYGVGSGPWSLISTIADGPNTDVLMVHAANTATGDPVGQVLLQSLFESGALPDLRVPLGGFSATARDEGPIGLVIQEWLMAEAAPGMSVSPHVFDTGLCISSSGACVGSLPELPPPPPVEPETPAPVVPESPVAPAPESTPPSPMVIAVEFHPAIEDSPQDPDGLVRDWRYVDGYHRLRLLSRDRSETVLPVCHACVSGLDEASAGTLPEPSALLLLIVAAGWMARTKFG